jgi:hypothetical protein
MTEKEEAREELQKVVDALPLQLTESQKTVIGDAIYDFVNHLLAAVREEYHVVSK